MMLQNNFFQDLFYRIESILKQFVDVDHLLSLCVKIPKSDNFKSAEGKINKVSVVVLVILVSCYSSAFPCQNLYHKVRDGQGLGPLCLYI